MKGLIWLLIIVVAIAATMPVLMVTGVLTPAHYPKYAISQSERSRLFKECVAAIPTEVSARPDTSWSYMAAQCDEISKDQARVCVANCERSKGARFVQ